MKKRALTLIFAILTAFTLALAVGADTGPKPSVVVEFDFIGDRTCYATLLSRYESTGPASAWDGESGYEDWIGGGEEIWRAFIGYVDSDGFHYLQENWLVSDETPLAWTYYPPSEFKVLLYFPDTGEFVSSGIYERYAFDSYFDATLSGGAIELGHEPAESAILLERDYDYAKELGGFFARLVITLALELLLALLFGLRDKGAFKIVLVTNIVTQIALNLTLSIYAYFNGFGFWSYLPLYFLLELAIMAVEAVVYALTFRTPRYTKVSVLRAVCYAIIANFTSLAVGYLVSIHYPAIF